MRIFIIPFLIQALSTAAGASILDVFPDSSGAYPDIQQALGAAQPGDSIRLADGIYRGPGNRNLLLGGELTIFSASDNAAVCVLDIESSGRGFLVYSHPGAVIRIAALTVRGGDPRSLPEGQLPGWGGALAIEGLAPGGEILVERCVFEENMADAGGALFGYQCSPTILNCTFRNNVATDGAGAYLGQCNLGDPVLFSGSIFDGGDYPYPAVGGYGAGLYFSHSFGRVETSTFVNNSAWIGGGLLISTSSNVDVEDCLIASSLEGEGLAVHQGLFDITNCDIFGNAGGDWVGAIVNQQDLDCNFSSDPFFCDAENGNFYLDAASPCLPGNHPAGCDSGQVGALGQGCDEATLVAAGEGVPASPLGLAAWPTLSSGRVKIRYTFSGNRAATLNIYDIRGRVIRTFHTSHPAGVIGWDGSDAGGRQVAPGAYFVRISDGRTTKTNRVTIIR